MVRTRTLFSKSFIPPGSRRRASSRGSGFGCSSGMNGRRAEGRKTCVLNCCWKIEPRPCSRAVNPITCCIRPPVAPHRGRNPSSALRNVHLPGHGARHGGGRAWRRDRRNRPQHLQNRPGIAARDGRKRVSVEALRRKIAQRHRRFGPNPGATMTPNETTQTP